MGRKERLEVERDRRITAERKQERIRLRDQQASSAGSASAKGSEHVNPAAPQAGATGATALARGSSQGDSSGSNGGGGGGGAGSWVDDQTQVDGGIHRDSGRAALGGGGASAASAEPSAAPNVEPSLQSMGYSEETAAFLQSMGYSEEQVTVALRVAGGNVDHAINVLLPQDSQCSSNHRSGPANVSLPAVGAPAGQHQERRPLGGSSGASRPSKADNIGHRSPSLAGGGGGACSTMLGRNSRAPMVGGGAGGAGMEDQDHTDRTPNAPEDGSKSEPVDLSGCTCTPRKRPHAAADDDCNMCMERPIDCTLVPCGHFWCCFKCADNFEQCPVCNKHVDQKIKTFRASCGAQTWFCSGACSSSG